MPIAIEMTTNDNEARAMTVVRDFLGDFTTDEGKMRVLALSTVVRIHEVLSKMPPGARLWVEVRASEMLRECEIYDLTPHGAA
jgi:hypothetical protein